MTSTTLCAELAHEPHLELGGSQQAVAAGRGYPPAVGARDERVRGVVAGFCLIAGAVADLPLPLPGPEPSKRKRYVRREDDRAVSAWVKAAVRHEAPYDRAG